MMNSPSTRSYFIDWLRIIAILLVLFFHTAMIFVAEEAWHIKNAQTSHLWLEFNFWLSRFRMPLLFFISGVGCYFALGKRNGATFIKERFNRLLIPLLAGMLLIVPPQIYFERLVQGVPYTSYLDFYPSIFDFSPYPKGNTSWHHLWFILYLFVYSVLALPLFLYLRKGQGQQKLAGWNLFSGKYSLYLVALPTSLIFSSLTLSYPGTNDLIHDYCMFPYYFTFFLTGFIVQASPNLWQRIEDNRHLSLKMAIICIVIMNYFRWNDMEPWDAATPLSASGLLLQHALLAIYGLNAWSWVLAMSGYGRKYLNVYHPILKYANEAIYPFYILHQTIIVMIGYYVVKAEESILMKYLFINLVSFVLIMAIYECLIKPFRLTRFLLGMKVKKKVIQHPLINRKEPVVYHT